MAVLVTGATGTLGRELVAELAKTEEVIILARNPRKAEQLFEGFTVIPGDVTEPFDLVGCPKIDAVYHLAGLLDLGNRHQRELWQVNVIGTRNIIWMMKDYNIPHLYYCSTAYTGDRNYYEETKAIAERDVRESGIPSTIFKLGIIVPNSKTLEIGSPQHLYLFAALLARIHRRMEITRKSVEGSLHLPPKKIGCRVRGDPNASLNLVPVDWVAQKIAGNGDGTLWLTNPRATRVSDILECIGEILFLKLQAIQEFKMGPHEALVDRLARPFLAYIEKPIPEFPSSFDDCPVITREFIQKTLIKSIVDR